jgi:F-type H+-transporting ATPase subunit gamma
VSSMKELRTRRKSITATRKVTGAMKMIAASKLKKSQDNMIKARPYSSEIKHIIQMLVLGTEHFTSEFFMKRPQNRSLFILISSDRGLCGGFNANIAKTFRSMYAQDSEDKIIAIGNKISAYLQKNNIATVKSYRNAFHELDFSLASSVGADILRLYKNNIIDRAVLVYNRFQSALSQVVVRETILPIEMDEDDSNRKKYTDILFLTEPSPGKLFDIIFPRYINFLLWRGVLESYASENAARMTTMDSAADNATEMIDDLTLIINKERQASITQEISEIVGGAVTMNI